MTTTHPQRSAESALLTQTAHALFEQWTTTSDSWSTLENTGLTLVGIPEELGGSGGTTADAAVIVHACAYHAVPAPITETLWLAAPLLAATRLPIPSGPLTAAIGDRTSLRLTSIPHGAWRLDGTLHRVPWARDARAVVIHIDDRVVVVDPSHASLVAGANLAGEPRDDLVFDGVTMTDDVVVAAPATFDPALHAAHARTVQLTGAAQRALDLSVRYAGERVQFGRPIARFQVVQQYLSTIAGEVALMSLAARSALRAGTDSGDARAAVAAARITAARGAGIVAELAHQIHGAIGTTEEHDLHTATRRLWAWREEHGNEHTWARTLGKRASASDPWEFVTSLRRCAVRPTEEAP
ncbi:acyl-CoA dehydrogenase family protein [Rhodococcus indonesiensis]|uniref:acyl-CoA dehydrogenase family protein n=1 Tax=Rhodococcus indonesiensis TaxID=3055869 RepID=UPI0039F6D9E3